MKEFKKKSKPLKMLLEKYSKNVKKYTQSTKKSSNSFDWLTYNNDKHLVK
jgi:hypothetical protein